MPGSDCKPCSYSELKRLLFGSKLAFPHCNSHFRKEMHKNVSFLWGRRLYKITVSTMLIFSCYPNFSPLRRPFFILWGDRSTSGSQGAIRLLFASPAVDIMSSPCRSFFLETCFRRVRLVRISKMAKKMRRQPALDGARFHCFDWTGEVHVLRGTHSEISQISMNAKNRYPSVVSLYAKLICLEGKTA